MYKKTVVTTLHAQCNGAEREKQSAILAFSTQLCELLPPVTFVLVQVSPSPPPSLCKYVLLYTRIPVQCVMGGGGGGVVVWGLKKD